MQHMVIYAGETTIIIKNYNIWRTGVIKLKSVKLISFMKSCVPTRSLLFLRKAYTHTYTLYNIHIYIYRSEPVYNIIVKVLRKYSRTTLIFDLEFNVQILSFERVRIVKLLLFCEKHKIREYEEKKNRAECARGTFKYFDYTNSN